MRRNGDEHGQAVVEFALISLLLFTISIGLLDSGRAFFQYNAVSAAARYGARWGAVVGGSCASILQRSTSDWCNQLNNNNGGFWTQAGNKPLEGPGLQCPTYSTAPTDYYQVSTYVGTSKTTIVGAIAQKIDSDGTHSSFVVGRLTPGLDLSKLEVCIETASSLSTPAVGDTIGVVVYYPFTGATTLLTHGTISLNATSQYQME